ncbi:MAG: AraC family transcriptional regulator [Cyanobacteria bacterium P01_G01_bin.38]
MLQAQWNAVPDQLAPSPEPVRVQYLQNPAGEGHYHAEGEHTLFISLAPRPIHYLQAQDGKTHTGLYRQGDMLVTPANTPLFVRWAGDEDCLQIQLTAQFLQTVALETLDRDCDRIALTPAFQVRNPQLESISMMLFTEFQQGASGNRLYLDSLANVLAVNLLRQHTTTISRLPIYEGGLPQRQLIRVLEYIEAYLDQDIKLASLAQLLDMSQFHFSHLFKQSMGISPYQYLLQQRVERAKQLLKQTDQSILQIALECGFSSHSHLSKQFRQLTGMTPKVYRAS